MAEDNVRRALVLTAGDPSPFFTRPISLVLFCLLVLSVVGPTSLGRNLKSRITALWSRKR
jgi:putative tricarboxylic transport membrane protein